MLRFKRLVIFTRRTLPSNQQKRLTKQKKRFEFWPNYSADGKHIVYTTWDDAELGDVRIVSAKGGRGKVIVEQPGHYVEPTFSPDGKSIVYRQTHRWLSLITPLVFRAGNICCQYQRRYTQKNH